jgi:hypothetical protein
LFLVQGPRKDFHIVSQMPKMVEKAALLFETMLFPVFLMKKRQVLSIKLQSILRAD